MLGLVLFQLLGFTVYFNLEKAKIRKQLKTFIKEGVPENQLKVFEFSLKQIAELNWVKKKEFKIGDRFYDVVRKRQINSGLFRLECVNDMQETKLFKNLAQFVDFNISSQQDNQPISLWFSYLNEPTISNSIFELTYGQQILLKQQNFFYQEKYSTFELELNTPPPIKI